jgi:predicted RNase H-like HicB family nuclease
MEYPVIVEHINGAYRALIPALSNLSAEGATREEAVQNVRRAAEAYLSTVEVTTIELALPLNQRSQQTLRPGSPQAVLRAAGKFKGDEEAMLQHLEEIYAERRRQREEVEREIDESERRGASTDTDEKAV